MRIPTYEQIRMSVIWAASMVVFVQCMLQWQMGFNPSAWLFWSVMVIVPAGTYKLLRVYLAKVRRQVEERKRARRQLVGKRV